VSHAQRSLSLAGVETSRLRTEMALKSGVEAGGAMIRHQVRSADILRRQAGARDLGGAPADRYWHLATPPGSSTSTGPRRRCWPACSPGCRSGWRPAEVGRGDHCLAGPQWRRRKETRRDGGCRGGGGKEAGGAAAGVFSLVQIYGIEGTNPAELDKILPTSPSTAMAADQSDGGAGTGPAKRAGHGGGRHAKLEARSRLQCRKSGVQRILAKYENFLTVAESSVYL
jgi:hypothetical protein